MDRHSLLGEHAQERVKSENHIVVELMEILTMLMVNEQMS